MSKSKTIITTTTVLSQAIRDIKAEADASGGRIPSNQSMLNTLARGIAGPKHDWGYLTGAIGGTVQVGLPAARLAEIEELAAPASKAHTSKAHSKAAPLERIKGDPDAPHLQVIAQPAALYEPEMASYLASQYTDGLIAIFEEFSTDGAYEDSPQCMFEPGALFVQDDKTSFVPKTLWGQNPEFIERTGRAYFAASASPEVNRVVDAAMIDWCDEASVGEFHAYYLPHAVIVAPKNPDYAIENMLDCGFNIEDEDERATIVKATFQVFLDETLSLSQQEDVRAQAEDFLSRLMRFVKIENEDFRNILVTLPAGADA